jgi:hypothetical protein
MGLPRELKSELAESLTGSTQPGLASPGGSEQAQRYHPASLSSESGESLRHTPYYGCYSLKHTRNGDPESVRGRRSGLDPRCGKS